MKAGELISALVEGRRYTDVLIPRTSKRAKMRLLTRAEVAQVKADAREALASIGCVGPAVGTWQEWHEEIATRTVAIAVREYDNPELQLATVEDWQRADDNTIGALFIKYQDFDREMDPLSKADTSQEMIREVEAGIKKKSLALLMNSGSHKLASYLLTLESPPET